MKAIIFGVSGQDGHYLTEICRENSVEVFGVSRSAGKWIAGDVASFEFVDQIVRDIRPDYIFHLAANSTTQHEALLENHSAIVIGAFNILDSATRHTPNARIFLCGSGLQFKNTGNPISENDIFEARDAYSVARIQSVYLARYYRLLGAKVYIGYFFNHDSPLRTERHVNQKIASAIKRIATGSREKLLIGNMKVMKEFSFARDIMQAVWLLVNQDVISEVVVGSGIAYSIEDYAKACFSRVNLNYLDHVEEEEGFSPDYKILISSPKLIMNLGWSPKFDFNGLIDIMMRT